MPAARSLSVRPLPQLAFAGLAGLLVLVEFTIGRRADFGQHPALPWGVAADLGLGLPLLFYLLVVRPYRLAPATLLAAAAAGLALCRWLLPTVAGAPVLAATATLAASLEALSLSYLLLRARRLYRNYQVARAASADFLDNLTTAARPLFGPLTGVLVGELAVLRYALAGRRAPLEAGAGEQVFSTDRSSAFRATLGALLGLGLVEATAAHLLLARWWPPLAWAMTAGSLYGLLWLVAHGRAVRRRPVLLSATTLTVRVGLAWRVRIPRSQVRQIEKISEAPSAPACLNAAGLLLTAPNLLLTLAEPLPVVGPYGRCRSVRQLAFFVDEPAALLRALTTL